MLEKIKEKWDQILLHIKEEHELTDVSFKTWLLPTEPSMSKEILFRSWCRTSIFSDILREKWISASDYDRRTDRNRM